MFKKIKKSVVVFAVVLMMSSGSLSATSEVSILNDAKQIVVTEQSVVLESYGWFCDWVASKVRDLLGDTFSDETTDAIVEAVAAACDEML
ncbi:MAG: hypothetical protein IIC74_08950 [Bacteroidetes bacterium]|nr:hypothetical protein [Bacteroidota bacterium]